MSTARPLGTPGDEIPNTRACSVAWEPDGAGFFYTRYPEGDEYNRTVHHHRLGTDWRDDPVVWPAPGVDRPDAQAWPHVVLSPDGRWLLVARHVRLGPHRPAPARPRLRRVDHGDLLASTPSPTSASRPTGSRSSGSPTSTRPRKRVVRIPLDERLGKGPESWETLVAERDDVISAVSVTAAGLVMYTSRAAVDTVHLLDADGNAAASRRS